MRPGDDAYWRIGALQRAINVTLQRQAPDSGWRCVLPDMRQPTLDADTSVIYWVTRSIEPAAARGSVVDPAYREGVLKWLARTTESATGRTGYVEPGQPSARVPGMNADFPSYLTETLSAEAAVLQRMLAGDDTREIRARQLGLVLAALPEWDDECHSVDFGYWLSGTEALQDETGPESTRWRKLLTNALVEHQRKSGAAAGSWDPDGAWCPVGGRSYATAMGALILLRLRAGGEAND